MSDKKTNKPIKKPTYQPKPMTPQTAPNDQIDKFFTEDNDR